MKARQDRSPKLHRRAKHLKVQFKASLSFFMASALTVFEAGFALKTQGSFVNGLMPFFAGVAGFFFNFKFNMPASLKFPFLDFLGCHAEESINDALHLLV